MKINKLITAIMVLSLCSFNVQASATRSAAKRANKNATLQKESLSDEYNSFKNMLNNDYGFNYSIDISYMPQRTSPSGRKTAWQTIIYPSFVWTNFDNEYGSGSLNFAYNIVRYGGASATRLANNSGFVTAINDYDGKSNAFDELYYNYRLPAGGNWLSVAVGQFPLYNFDGSEYDSNQQVNFLNYALSQNATSTYPTAGLGGYAQANPTADWSLAVGMQNAENVDGESIKFNNLHDKHFTTFASVSYTPTISRWGASDVSLLLYNQPSVKSQVGTTNGWSVNLSQNIGDNWSLFGRLNGVSGNVSTIDFSWVIGGVLNNPLDRNPLDQIGFAFAYNHIDQKAVGTTTYHQSEKVIETYWAWGISKWATITPDIQIYIDPSQNRRSDFGTAVSLRATLFF